MTSPAAAHPESPDEREQFLALFVAQQHRVFRFIMSLVPGRSDAEELFQETALTLWRRWSEFDASREFTPWACGIALNLVRNWRRKDGRRGPQLSPAVVESLADLRLGESESWERLHRALAYCLEKLPDEQRALIEECYGRNLSIKTIAECSQRTPNVVYKLLAKIRHALHDCIVRRAAEDFTVLGGEGA